MPEPRCHSARLVFDRSGSLRGRLRFVALDLDLILAPFGLGDVVRACIRIQMSGVVPKAFPPKSFVQGRIDSLFGETRN